MRALLMVATLAFGTLVTAGFAAADCHGTDNRVAFCVAPPGPLPPVSYGIDVPALALVYDGHRCPGTHYDPTCVPRPPVRNEVKLVEAVICDSISARVDACVSLGG